MSTNNQNATSDDIYSMPRSLVEEIDRQDTEEQEKKSTDE